jgi:signal transduction histidine kinase
VLLHFGCIHFTSVKVSALALLAGTLVAGFIGWNAFIVDGSDSEQKQTMGALRLGLEQVGDLLNQIEEPKTEAQLLRQIRVSVAVAISVTAAMGIISWRTAHQAAEDADWVAHTYEVTGTLELTLRNLDDVETGARGFALTGQGQFLEPYKAGRDATRLDLEKLHLLTMDNPDQQRRLGILVEQVKSRENDVAVLVDARQNSGKIPPVAYLSHDKQLMDAARITVAAMVAAEKRLLEVRRQHSRETQHLTDSAIGLGSLLSVIFLSIAGVTVSREIRSTARSEAQVRFLNADLERRVEQRTKALVEQAVELQRTRDEMEYRVITRTEELAKANETLTNSNIELQQFAYVASHDLQSPLRSISGFVQLLKMEYDEQLDDQAHDYIRRTVQSIVQMQTLIRDLLSYSRVDARSRPFVAVALDDVFHGSVSLLESSIRDSGGQVTCDELPVVLGDVSQLTQLMQNLISNGLKYHGTDPPHIHVSAEPGIKKNEWIVSVRDNGIGIEAEYFGRIFEIFKRLHGQKEYPGTGIGLAVCRRVVERHGGAIWVESEPGHGSNFRFSIPAGAAEDTGKTGTTEETNDQQLYWHEGG